MLQGVTALVGNDNPLTGNAVLFNVDVYENVFYK